MTLRTRVTLAAGFAVLLAVVAASITVYVVMRGNLYTQTDESLQHNASTEQHDRLSDAATAAEHLTQVQDTYMQVVDDSGDIIATVEDRSLPVTADVRAVARGELAETFFTADVDGTAVRVYAGSQEQGTALQIGRSLAEVEQTLRQLMWTLIAISVATVGLAAAIGRLVAAAAVAPVNQVADAADTVAKTGELFHHIAVPTGDDLGRLAANFNTMLDALSESLARQRQLVADASHELRTPLASVRTNVEVLTRAEELAPDDRAMLIRDTVAQIGELTRLVGDLVELARGDGQHEPFTIVDLYDLTRHAVHTAERNYPSTEFHLGGTSTLVQGAGGRISRAVSNLIDNAAKWSPPQAEVEITVRNGAVTVRDHGPGVDPADLPHIFDRFYRSPEARAMPGSGLGLAIVKQVADSHGATITAAAADGGGALFILRFATAAGHRVTEPEVRSRFSHNS